MPPIREQYGQSILSAHHESIGGHIPPLVASNRPHGQVVKIGVIGAGIAGLYTALMIDYLKAKSVQEGFDFHYEYELLEANTSTEHIGGRLYTHRFSEKKDDYYDVGAMRFPQLDWMKPTFDLMKYLDISLIPYIMDDKEGNNISFFNGIRKSQKELDAIYNNSEIKNKDPFKTRLPNLTASPEKLAEIKINSFKTELIRDWHGGWKNLMSCDEWSTRDYMALGPAPKFTDKLISYLETFDSSTSLYDCALSESVMDSLDFDYPTPPPWFCIEGGTDKIASRAIQKISQPVKRGKRVTAIMPVGAPGKKPHSIKLTVNDTTEHEYHHVVSTIPFGCLRLVDTSRCNFSWDLQTAIRDLRYDGSTKVAIQFKSRWWEKLPAPQVGGVSSTDRPTRTVVYPSYGIGGEAATIIVSYTWGQDAFRNGAMVQGKETDAEKCLINRILRDLTDMHHITDTHGKLDYTYLPKLKTDHHAYNWYGSEYSMGAFALFGPGQFRNLYPLVTEPAFGLLHFAGEATSVHHAWVVGALNSAYRSLVEIFKHEGRQDLVKRLHKEGSPFIHAGTHEISLKQVEQQVRLGQSRHM